MRKMTKKHIDDNRKLFTRLFKYLNELFPKGFDTTDIKCKMDMYEHRELKQLIEECFNITKHTRKNKLFNIEFIALEGENFGGLCVRVSFGTVYPFIIKNVPK